MADLIFLAVIGVFFAICAWYVRAADRLIEKSKTHDERLGHEEVLG